MALKLDFNKASRKNEQLEEEFLNHKLIMEAKVTEMHFLTQTIQSQKIEIKSNE